MILHFMDDSVYTNSFIQYVNSNFNSKQMKFVIITSTELKYITEKENVLQYEMTSLLNAILQIKQIIKKYKPKKMFLHFLSDLKLFPIFFASNKTIKYWIVWGSDFYSHINFKLFDKETEKIIGSNNLRNWKQKILLLIRKIAIRKIDYIGINETEFSIIRKYFRTNAKRVDFKYPNPMQIVINSKSIKLKKRNPQKIILLGNSGEPSNNHISILKKLKNLNCDYKVIVPLSYGSNDKYIKAVFDIGKGLLREHFVPLLDFMPSDEYFNLLSTVDVVIMNHYRQQGAGNLRVLLNLGKKIYLNENNPLYHYYTNEGIFLSKIDDEMFNEFIFEEYSKEIKEKNKVMIENLYSQEKIFDYMKEVFEM